MPFAKNIGKYVALIAIIVLMFMGLSNFFPLAGKEGNSKESLTGGRKNNGEKRLEEQSWLASLISNISLQEIKDKGLSLREARFYKQLASKNVQCFLCPNRCLLAQNERGVCRVRVNIDGRLKTLIYGKPIAVHVDPIEKKPLYHFLPESLAFSIATSGCNLNCIFCQNWQISQSFPEKAYHYNLSPGQVVQKAVKTGSRSIAYTYTEPTVFYEYMLDTARLAKEQGIKNVWITCGYINREPLEELCKYIDGANVDLKGFSEEFYRKYTTGKLAPVLETLKVLKKNKVTTEITNLVIPGSNDDFSMIEAMCEWIVDNMGPDCPLHFSRFFPHYKLKNKPPTPIATLKKAKAIAHKVGLKYVYIGNVRSDGDENTYCPACKEVLVRRRGYFVSQNNIRQGKCRYCGTVIYGVWE